MKNKKMIIYYDEEGDYLEITLKKSKDTYFNELKKDCAQIIDQKSGEIVGYAVFNFRKRKNSIDVEFPITKEMVA